jgi:hypothetical protein
MQAKLETFTANMDIFKGYPVTLPLPCCSGPAQAEQKNWQIL